MRANKVINDKYHLNIVPINKENMVLSYFALIYGDHGEVLEGGINVEIVMENDDGNKKSMILMRSQWAPRQLLSI